jgi:hypothetical protein
MTNQERLAALRGKHAGRRCFVVGNGPSLREIDMRRLANDVTIICNLLFRDTVPFWPTYYCIEDRMMAANFGDEIQDFSRPGMVRVLPRDLAPLAVGSNDVLVNFERRPDGRPFSTDLCDGAFWAATVGYLMLQLAYHLGADPVYLIGMDCGTDHFVSEKNYYAGKGHNKPHWDIVFDGYRTAKRAFEADGRRVINATAGGRLDVFERADFASLFEQENGE